MRNYLKGFTAVAALCAGFAQVAEAKDYKVAVIRWEPNDIYFNGVALGQQQEAKRIQTETGDTITFNVFGANDAGDQLNALQAQVDRGVDGVLLTPWRGEAMRAIVQQLNEAGVPVVTSNAWVPGVPQTFVAFDNETAGRLGGEALVKRLDTLRGEGWRKDGGVFIELRCIITASFDIARHKGYRSALDPIAAEYPGVKIVEQEAGCDGGKASKAVNDIISREGPDKILGVASIDGTMGVGGAVPAFKAQDLLFPIDNPKHIPIATIDGTVPEFQSMARGEIDHISVQPATGEGTITMRLLYDLMSGKPLPTEANILLPGETPLWAPVKVSQPDAIKGPWYQTQAYSVPGVANYDDPRNWANEMAVVTTGKMPDFGK
ncbi:ribose transport system substrate-binding protein [Kaistia hirudinis]|uniref:Ribose transport system substrate-binding protein n=1 Tax=Kaistia hirudinis TaxID=1293440 RepID=A0A840AUH7_9HYPH|nr:sugar ABC transporter substrate-binding protein [Kaistia hirudinis]MBB3932105.1 ribose transport system substrate-binding protein [Kaistia hirudinis]MBN9016739.1 sugar ABC transporter substrate-binding protein [Hyphomicrobiales bacterium]